ncbi:unnamed protein product [Protopolystoma xenopodis]|uniref:Uncharacterized protein n=1 Tax=Protopolystoma xenopodis TaxID=117903 RepID=A0A3S4ZR77_9PLAT|nr:unnamed protein product [Protopolystoma xenopodis]
MAWHGFLPLSDAPFRPVANPMTPRTGPLSPAIAMRSSRPSMSSARLYVHSLLSISIFLSTRRFGTHDISLKSRKVTNLASEHHSLGRLRPKLPRQSISLTCCKASLIWPPHFKLPSPCTLIPSYPRALSVLAISSSDRVSPPTSAYDVIGRMARAGFLDPETGWPIARADLPRVQPD